MVLGSCEQQTHFGSQGDGADDAAAEGITQATLGGASDPTVTITKPTNNYSVTYVDPGSTVTVEVEVTDVMVGPSKHHLAYYLDGVEVQVLTAVVPYSFTGVSIGRHQFAVRLVTANGATLPNVESLDTVHVKVVTTCADAASCDDGLTCSNEACVGNVCNYGPVPNCCDSEFECPYDWYCESNTCVECFDDGDANCDDGDLCTIDSCDAAQNCVNDPQWGCCHTDANCDDSNACTIDACDVPNNQCLYVNVPDPLCCNIDADCEPSDPCVSYICYENTDTGSKKCRYGPPEVACCTDDAACDDGNPCTLDLCSSVAGAPSGTCTYETNPATPQCCVSHTDCDDEDPSTLDSCVANTCQHEENPGYCLLPATSAIVITEIMAATGDINDEYAEWIEIHNASDSLVNLAGYTLKTDGGETHTLVAQNALGGAGALHLFPGAYYVLGRNADSTINGGFVPNYDYSGITLPDPFETGQEVVRTLILEDPDGNPVDSVTYDTATWPSMDGHSWALIHTHAANDDGAHWRVSGTHQDPAQNVTYGQAANQLYGTPKNANSDMGEALPHEGCVPPADAHGCATGACNEASQCVFPLSEGCCETDADCHDYDDCTVDGCDVAASLCKAPEIDPECCTVNEECDDGNPCNLDRCIGGMCRYSLSVVPNCCTKDIDCDDADVCTIDTCDEASSSCALPEPLVLDGGQVCCNDDAECDDSKPNTLDLCDFNSSPPVCLHVDDPEYCASLTDPCDDGVKCTTDLCDLGIQQCQHVAMANCCTKNSDCPQDGNPCTAEVCEVADGSCKSYGLEGCCTEDSQCVDGNLCTVDLCGASNLCHHDVVDGCCNDASDCEDDASCTVDSCVDNACINDQLGGCCEPGDSPGTLEAACGSDPDGAATCFVWDCTDLGQCDLLQNATCCASDPDCDDGDPCTADACTPAQACKHIQKQEGGLCCIIDEDCPNTDGKSCTEPSCDGGLCTELKIAGCAEPVEPPMEGGPTSGIDQDDWDPGSEPGACWKTDNGGSLGPDPYARCLGNFGNVGAGAILSSPAFNPSGHDAVSVQFNLAWDHGSGDHTVTIFVTQQEGDYESAEVLDILSASGTNDGTLYSYSLSNFMTAQTQVWVGWQVDSTEPGGVDVGVDDFVAATGNAPFFVANLQTDKTYGEAEDRLDDGGTITGKLGESINKVYWAHDVEWNSQTLAFELIGAPNFVSIIDTAKLNVYGVWQVKVSVQALTPAQIGSYDAVLRVSDGAFLHEIPVHIIVDLGAGYVLWEPQGVAPEDGDALADALAANNTTVQRVKALDEVSDWTQVLGLFITAGGGDAPVLLTNSKVKIAVDFLDDGGDVYMEGSRVWADDSQTPLQNRFKLSPVDANIAWAGALAGRSIHHGGSWQYAASPAYLTDVDSLAPKSGSGSRTAMADGDSGVGLAVVFENPSGARTYGASTLLSRTAAQVSTPEELIASVLDFFENGYPPCSVHAQCADGDPCTIDTCVGGICQNAEDLDCDKCQVDGDCAAGGACKANGDCVPMPGNLEGDPTPPTQGNCSTTDELIFVTKYTSGFATITEANVHIHLTLDPSQKLGEIDMWLSHNGVKIHLIEPDATEDATELDVTFDLGRKPVSGSMNDFIGTLVQGPWVLSIEDTNGGEACYTLSQFDIYLTASPIGACASSAECQNGQACDGVEICAGVSCLPGTPLTADDCADTDPCTKDKCDPFLAGGAGQCVSAEREATCAGAPCSGAHAVDAGDGQCGLLDACSGGLDQGDGSCKLVCGTCIDAHSGAVDTELQDFQCITETVEVDTDNPFVSKVSIRADVEHGNLGDLTLKLISPQNAGVTIMDGDVGEGLQDFHSTFPDSNPLGEDKLCALNGTDPAGTWKLQICDNDAGSQGVLHSWSIWVGTTDIDPTVGQSCGNAVLVSSADTDGIPMVLANSTQCFADTAMGSCTGADGHDVVYTFAISTVKRVTAELVSPSHDSGLYITDGCGAKSTYCADAGGVGDSEKLDVLVDPGVWYLVVDSVQEDSWGDSELYLEFQVPSEDGAVCDEDLDCKSGHCQNGFCCASGDCCTSPDHCPGGYTKVSTCDVHQTCQGHRVDPTCDSNICGTVDVLDDTACTLDTEAKGCGLFVSAFCNGEPVQTQPPCLTECAANDQCDPGSHCYQLTNTCRLDNPDGAPCFENSHCSSEFCVDSVCCATVCDGLCEQCDAPGQQGQCTKRKTFTDPEGECPGENLCGGTCDGGGQCQFPVDTLVCAECTRCDGDGFCQNYTSAGQDIDDSCAICQACDGGGSCIPVPDGADYLDQCPDKGASLCNYDGACDGGSKYDGTTGEAACRLYAPGTVCVAQSCAMGYVDPDRQCDGEGICVDYDDIFCDGHVCTGPQCLTPCANDGECLSGYYCEDGTNGPVGTCQPKKVGGETCVVDHECKSNFCTDGVCCETPCKGPCRQCGGGVDADGSFDADLADGTVFANGQQQEGNTATVGAQPGTSSAVYVMPFSLPTLPGDSIYGTAHLSFTLNGSPFNAAVHVDLYGLGVRDAPDVLPSDYFEGADDGSVEKLQNDILQAGMNPGVVETDAAADLALADYLNDVYEDGFNAGRYAFFRLSVDASPVPSGANWTVATTESGSVATVSYTTKAGSHGPGACFDHESLTDPEEACGLYWCNGSGNCRYTCDVATNVLGGSSDCKPGHWCDGGQCEPLAQLGDFCSAGVQCQSQICNLQDSVCCDATCESTCASCKLAGLEGTCTWVPDTEDPDADCNGDGFCGGVCDGAGSCYYPDWDTDCGTCSRCDGGGECHYVAQNTDPDEDCGLCATCNATGACVLVKSGSDIHDDCPDEGVNVCGLNGACDGQGACDFYGINEDTGAIDVASPAMCLDVVVGYPPNQLLSLADTCDGAGNIVDNGLHDCAPYKCYGVACLTACTEQSDCTDESFCDVDDLNQDGRTDDCVAKRIDGSQCHTDNDFECKSGTCSNGFCCGEPDGDCCGVSGDCTHLASPGVCDMTQPGGCDGSRIDAFCNGNKVCKTHEVDYDAACGSLECQSMGCLGGGLLLTQPTYCDLDGGCTVGGTVETCDDGNPCTLDACDVVTGCEHTNNEGLEVPCYQGPEGTANVGACKSGSVLCVGGQTEAFCTGQVLPDLEVCDGVDNDCDGQVDEENADGCSFFFLDSDQDGYGVNENKCLCEATVPYSALIVGDCNDGEAGANPGNVDELCSTDYDDNCNSKAQEDDAVDCLEYYFDGDDDGYGSGAHKCKCGPEAPYSSLEFGDCNDGNNQINPGRDEICNDIDDNCDGKIDTAELTELQLCGAIDHGTPGCGSGVCYVKSCEVDYFNMDGIFANGCEATVDNFDKLGWSDFCGDQVKQSVAIGSSGNFDKSEAWAHPNAEGQWHIVKDIPPYWSGLPTWVYVSGTMVPHGDVDWFKFRFVDGDKKPGSDATLGMYFHADIRFTKNPDGAFRFDVYRDSCNDRVCEAGKFYDVYSDFDTSGGVGNGNCGSGPEGTCGDVGINCCHKTTEAADRIFYVKVYRKDDAPLTASEYQLFVSNAYWIHPDAGTPPVCDPLATESEETCDGLDQDCDGSIDEGLGSSTCGLGVCIHSEENCIGNETNVCDALAGSSAESCDGLDNDCDGVTDEEQGTTTCGVGSCVNTTVNCVDGETKTCSPLDELAVPEQCNDFDDDCDGQVDEVSDLGTTTCGLGVCEHTEDNCIDHAPNTCDPFLGATAEICDGLDNDCDGLVDEADPDIAPCDDDNACTLDDFCQGGLCVGGSTLDCADTTDCTIDGCDPVVGCTFIADDMYCSDDDACNGGEQCDAAIGCVSGTPVQCGDGDVCNGIEVCDPVDGACLDGTVIDCQDGNTCNGQETCNPATGACSAGTALNCNDGNPCTDDSCNATNGCVNTNNSAGCNDGNACTTGDSCKSGACAGNALNCDDGNCNTLDGCNTSTGCTYTAQACPTTGGNEGDGNCPSPSFKAFGYCWIMGPKNTCFCSPDVYQKHKEICDTIGKNPTEPKVTLAWNASAECTVANGLGYACGGIGGCCAETMFCDPALSKCISLNWGSVYWNYGPDVACYDSGAPSDSEQIKHYPCNWHPVYTCTP